MSRQLASARWEGPSAGIVALSSDWSGGGAPPRIVREEIIRLLRRDGLEIPSNIAVEAIHDEEGDLLDAMIMVTAPLEVPIPAELAATAAVEAWVY
ncbi:MAG: hypothetical protein ACO3IB_03475 [Phycisphaerales bacterium]